MNGFFDNEILKKMKSLESSPKIIENFLTLDEVTELKEIEQNTIKKFVNRDDGTKTGFGIDGTPVKSPNEWHPRIREILLKKIEHQIGSFSIHPDEFPPHYLRTIYPIKLHADTGRDPNSVIYKQILIPLEVTPMNNPAYTIIFDRRWYGQASGFISKKYLPSQTSNHYEILDSNNKFIHFDDVSVFYDEVKYCVGKTVHKNDGIFKITKEFLIKLDLLINKERYNLQSNEHIINNTPFDKNLYGKYLSHLDYDSLQSLNIDTIFQWKPSSAIIWDRTKLHSSSNYFKDNVRSKLGMAIFTIKN